MKKNKYFLLITFSLFFLFLATHYVSALEVPLPGLNANPTLAEYVVYIFKFGISVAGILSLVSFAVGGIQLIASADSPEMASNAKDRMKNAAIGLILTVASTVIVLSINPSVGKFVNPNLPQQAGVYYADGTPAPVSDDSDNASSSSIYYKCEPNITTKLLVWTYPKKGTDDGNTEQADLDQIKVVAVDCGGSTSIGSGSFKWAIDAPGVYYCLKGCDTDMCTGDMSSDTIASADTLPDPFNKNVAAVRIVNDSVNKIEYGVVFHNQPNLDNGGECNYPVVNDKDYDTITCEPVENGMEVSAIDVFALNTTSSSGNGVVFYSKPTGWNTNSGGHKEAGFYPEKDNTLDFTKPITLQTSSMCYDYTNVDVPDAYKTKCENSACGDNSSSGYNNVKHNYTVADIENNFKKNNIFETSPYSTGKNKIILSSYNLLAEDVCDCGGGDPPSADCCDNTECSDSACETFEDCPGSIEVDGSYFVGIFSEDLLQNQVFCQTFTQTVPNLNVDEIIANGSEETGKVYIYPTQ